MTEMKEQINKIMSKLKEFDEVSIADPTMFSSRAHSSASTPAELPNYPIFMGSVAPKNAMTKSTLWKYQPSIGTLSQITDPKLQLEQCSIVQVALSLFALNLNDGVEWAQYTSLQSGSVVKKIKAAPQTPRENGLMINFNQSHIFYVGGKRQNANASSHVELYDIQNDTWQEAPAMNQKRIIHSGCSLGRNVYVYGGCTMTIKGPHFYSSIEILNA